MLLKKMTIKMLMILMLISGELNLVLALVEVCHGRYLIIDHGSNPLQVNGQPWAPTRKPRSSPVTG